jgi:hypothetical protein
VLVSNEDCRYSASIAPLRDFILHTGGRNQGSVGIEVMHPTNHSRDPEAAAASSAIGRVYRDRYVIQAQLGSGRGGTVFKALDLYRSSLPERQQYVALKVLHAGHGRSDQTIREARRELECGQKLSHRNIVKVFELDRDQDVEFFTMEFLEGELLSDLLERLRPATMLQAQAWQIIRQLGAGLEHAHESGIAHGDLKPRNILITRDGEVRILNFGTTQTTPAYASCESLEGRAAHPRDDLYALACICCELLGGAHPFAGRTATLARDFAVEATRPAGLTGRQWRTLKSGLSWHRGGRSIDVHTWIQKLTGGVADRPGKTPLLELKAAGTAKPALHPPAVGVLVALLLITGLGIAQFRATSDVPVPGAAPAAVATLTPVATTAPAAAPVLETPPQAEAPVIAQRKAIVPSAPSAISIDGYQLSADRHFVEIRVHRNQLQHSSFSWWTEPATARQDVDYVHQAKAIQTFSTDRRTTRFYVKLLPGSGRSMRDYFYVAIAQPGHFDHTSHGVTRLQIWLPPARDQLRASR